MAADGAGRRRRRSGTVRFRVTAVATAMVLLVLVAGGFAVVRAQAEALRSNVDDQLEAAAESLADGLEAGTGPGVLAGFGDDEAVFQVVAADGEVVAASADEVGRRPLVPIGATRADDDDASDDDGDEDDDDEDGVTRTVDGLAHEDGRFRVHVVPAADGATIVVAASLEDVDESVEALTGNLVVGIPVATALLAVVVWFVVGRTLRPVEAIRAEVAAIGGRELHRRVPEPAGDDEVARLARTMNGMLGRIEEASARQQRFVADASHELRSPLTRMRTELEVDLAHPEGADPRATQQSVLDEAIGLQRLVDDLLHLARSDAGARSGTEAGPVALDEVVGRAAADLRAAGRVAVDTDGVEPAVVDGRSADLRRLVTNLLDNAGRHARSGVTVSLRGVGDTVELVVADDGPGIPAEDAERVFERFTRLDQARTAGTGGTGLGLAIARDIAEAHGGMVEVDRTVAPGAGARLVVRLGRAGGGRPRPG